MQSNIKEYLSRSRKTLGPRSGFSDGVLESELLGALQRYKENPDINIEVVLKKYLS